MHETSVSRVSGQEATRTGWPLPTDRGDAPRHDPALRGAAPTEPMAPGADRSRPEAEEPSGQPGNASAATFPTSYARFSINAETQKLSITIVDAATDEVIREIPPEQVQRIAEDLQSLARRASIGKRPAPVDGVEQTASGGVDRYV